MIQLHPSNYKKSQEERMLEPYCQTDKTVSIGRQQVNVCLQKTPKEVIRLSGFVSF